MKKHQKTLKHRLQEFTYGKQSMDKKMLDLKKSFSEVSSMLNEKNKRT